MLSPPALDKVRITEGRLRFSWKKNNNLKLMFLCLSRLNRRKYKVRMPQKFSVSSDDVRSVG